MVVAVVVYCCCCCCWLEPPHTDSFWPMYLAKQQQLDGLSRRQAVAKQYFFRANGQWLRKGTSTASQSPFIRPLSALVVAFACFAQACASACSSRSSCTRCATSSSWNSSSLGTWQRQRWKAHLVQLVHGNLHPSLAAKWPPVLKQSPISDVVLEESACMRVTTVDRHKTTDVCWLLIAGCCKWWQRCRWFSLVVVGCGWLLLVVAGRWFCSSGRFGRLGPQTWPSIPQMPQIFTNMAAYNATGAA